MANDVMSDADPTRSFGKVAGTETGGAAICRVLVADRPRLLLHLIGLLGSSDDAREVWQCFAVRALARSGDLRDAMAVHGWMSKVLSTTLADHHRGMSRRRRREVPLDSVEADDAALVFVPEQPFMEAACACIHEHLPLLRPEYAEIVLRADLQREPREVIAASLGTTVNNVGVRLHRGRRALRQRLETACRSCDAQMHFGCGCPDLEVDLRCGSRGGTTTGVAAGHTTAKAE